MNKKHKKDAQHESSAEHNQNLSENSSAGASMVYTVRIQPNAEDEQRYTDEKSHRGKQVKQARNLNVISGIGAGIALAAVVIAGYYAWTSRQQLITMQQSQRPYLWAATEKSTNTGGLDFSVGNTGGPEVEVNIPIQNFGQFPAVVTEFTGDVEIGLNHLGLLAANNWQSYSSVMPSGRVDHFTVPSKEMTDPSVAINPNSIKVGVLLRLRYTDTSGNEFESDVCMYTPNGLLKTWSYCPADLHLNRLMNCQEQKCEQ